MENILQSLIDDYGNEKVIHAAEQLLNKEQRRRAGQYHELVTPEKISEGLYFVDQAVGDLLTSGKTVQEAYANRAEIVKQITQLETSIELDEAEAFMMADGNKVQIDGKTVTLSNDKMRDAYRKYVTRQPRTKLAELESELKRIEIEIAKAKDNQDTAKQSADILKARIYVTANLLKFLS